MGFDYDVYHDEDGNLQVDPMCPICGSTRGFYRKRVGNSYRGYEPTYHSIVTYCRNCDSDVKRESDGYTID